MSTIVMTLFGSFVGGLLWIGRPGLAMLSLPVLAALLAAVAWHGFPTLPIDQQWAPDAAQVALAAVSIICVLLLRKSSRPKGWHSRWYFALLIAFSISLTAALAIRSFLVQPFSSPSGSMAPTLVEGDNFFASKWAYGYSKYSLPLQLIDFQGRKLPSVPTRGDVVVFEGPEGRAFVKRVVGLPGEKIKMIDGALFINGQAAKREETGAAPAGDGAEGGKIFRETLPEGISYDTLDLQPDSITDNTEEFLVPDDSYFVLGDNRDNSLDSRLALGAVPFENLIGRAERIYWNSNGTPYADRQVVRPVMASEN